MVGAVLQARLGSTRLQEKALRLLDGQPLIAQVYNQAKACPMIDKIVLMTSDEPLDLKLISFVSEMGIEASTGPVNDIIGRLFNATEKFGMDYVVRIWGDCPFICPDIIEKMLQLVRKENLDFISNSDIQKRTFPPGVDIEIYSRALINDMNRSVVDPGKREFPIEYVRHAIPAHRQSRFHDENVLISINSLHLTVDYEDDLKASEAIYKILKSRRNFFNYTDLLNLIKNSPELFDKFSHEARNVEYKKFINDTKKDVV